MKNFPPPPPPKEKSGELTIHESSYILDSTLSYKDRQDTQILVFIDAFVRCQNVRQASSEAGVPFAQGQKWRNKSDIASAIQKLIDKSLIKYGFDASEVMERAKEIVDFDPIMLQNQDGTFKSNLHDIAPEARRSLKSMKVKNLYNQVEDTNGIKRKIVIGELIEYEFYDKLKAVDLVGREKDLFKTTSKVEHTVSKDMADILLDASRRGEQASKDFSKPDVITEGVLVESDDE